MKRKFVVPLALFSSMLARPVLAQTAPVQTPEQATQSLQNISGGTALPLTLKLKTLDKTWKRLSVGGPAEMSSMTALFSAGSDDVIYTQGKIEALGNQMFLVAYRMPQKKMSFFEMMRMGPNMQAAVPEPLSGETEVSLVLMNLNAVATIGEMKPFDLKAEIARRQAQIEQMRAMTTLGAPPNAVASNSESNLKQLGLGVLQYAVDYENTFPPMRTAEEAKKAVMPYVKNEVLFKHPETGEEYQPNPNLSNKKMATIAEPANTVLYYEMSVAPNGTRAVLYADGHVKRIPEADWQGVKKAQRIP